MILAHGVLDFAVPVATETPDPVLKLPLPTTGSIFSVARPTAVSDCQQSFFDADRIRLLEQIVEHSTGTVCFEKARLADILASLRPAAHGHATSEDEDFTINPVSPTTACEFTRSRFPAVTLTSSKAYSGELSHSNFSLRLQQRVERRLNEAVPEVRRPASPITNVSAHLSSYKADRMLQQTHHRRSSFALRHPLSSMRLALSHHPKLQRSLPTSFSNSPRQIIRTSTSKPCNKNWEDSIRCLQTWISTTHPGSAPS